MESDAPTSHAPVGTATTGPVDGPAELEVSIDQELCTGDGLCVEFARPVFEMDVDGLAYVKDADDELLTEPGAFTRVPLKLVPDVLLAARDCPGNCIHVRRVADRVPVAGPLAVG